MYTFELFDENVTITITNVENYFEALSKFNALTMDSWIEYKWNDEEEVLMILKDEV